MKPNSRRSLRRDCLTRVFTWWDSFIPSYHRDRHASAYSFRPRTKWSIWKQQSMPSKRLAGNWACLARSLSLDLEPLLFLFHDGAHTGSILRQQSECWIDLLRREKVDRPFPAFQLQLVQVENRNEFERFDLGPLEAVVSIAFHDDDLVLPDRHALDLVTEHRIDKDQDQPDGEKDHRPKDATGRAVESKEDQ